MAISPPPFDPSSEPSDTVRGDISEPWAPRGSSPTSGPETPGERVRNRIEGSVSGVAVQAGAATVTVHHPTPDGGRGSGWGWSAPVARVDPSWVGVHRSEGGLAPYVPRDRDTVLAERIAEAAERGGLVLAVGGSTAGKTRAAWHAVATHLPQRRVFVPTLGADLRYLAVAVAEHARDAGQAVVWLDDLDKHLNASSGLDPALVQRLGEAEAVVVATMRRGVYDRINTPSSFTGEGREFGRETGRLLLRGTTPIPIERLWSAEELERATQVATRTGRRELADATARQRAKGGHGVGEYLASAPRLADMWAANATLTRGEGGFPRGHRLVAAAVDLARIGVEHAPPELLEHTHRVYPLSALLRPEPFELALEWATREGEGTCGLLLPADADGCWRPFDYLVDTTTTPIPESLWGAALARTTDPNSLNAIGVAAHQRGFFTTAETAWREAAEHGHIHAMTFLGYRLRERGEAAEAERWTRRGAEGGNPLAMTLLGFLLRERGEAAEAERWARRGAEDGEPQAMALLGLLLWERDETAEAQTWYRRVAENGDIGAMVNLGLLLEQRGEAVEAASWYRRASESDSTLATGVFGFLLRERGGMVEAERWARRGAEGGNPLAMTFLGFLLRERGEMAEAERWTRRGAEDGEPYAMFDLAILLEQRGETVEAEAWQRRAAEAERDAEA